jgi:hypothetical protein
MPKFRSINGDGQNQDEPLDHCACGSWMVRPEYFMGLTRNPKDRIQLKAVIVFTDFYCVQCGAKRWTENHITGDLSKDKQNLIE